LPPYNPTYRGRWNSNTGPPGYRPLRYTRPRPDPIGGNSHKCNVDKRTGENPGGLPFALPAPNLPACLSGGLPVLMAGDLNAKHVDWNSRLITTRGRRLHDYANDHFCLIYGPEIPTTIPYNSSATPDVLDIVITKNLVIPVSLTTCSALSSDHFPVLMSVRDVDHPFLPARTSEGPTGSNSRPAWKTNFRPSRNCVAGWKSTRVWRKCPALSLRH
jgi:hypothetical protein